MLASIRAAIAFIVVVVIASFARAETYPSKPVRLIVGLAVGGGTDALARLIAQRLRDSLGQPVVVENRTGSDGDIATAFVASSKPDGHTLLMGFVVNMAQRHHMKKDVGYDPTKDFAPISMVARAYNILAINPKLPFKSVDELVEYAKAKPGVLNSATTGTDLVVELFKQVAGVNIVQIPYKGSAPAANSVVAGDTQMTFGGMVSTLPLVKAGRLRALAITSPQRVQAAADIPTLAELGYRGVEASSWYALYAPAGTPRPVIDRLSNEMIKISQEPEFVARLRSQGQESISGSPEELSAFMAAENEKWSSLIKAGGFRIEE